MKKISSTDDLKEAILLLEIKQANQAAVLKAQFKATYESIKPINLIKSSLKELATSPELKGDLLNASMGLAAGYLTKKVMVGATHNPLKQLLGTLLQVGVSSVVSKNASEIKSVASIFLNAFLKKKN